jgi:hypothetical protein
MNKKINSILFVLGATMFNVLVSVLSFLLMLIIYVKFIMHLLPQKAQAWSFSLIFIASLAIAFLVYRSVLRFLIKKIEIEKYFDPIFARKHHQGN